jgi:hypothetical protein
VFGGYFEDRLDKTDPYPTDDRGLWFDGKYTFLTLEQMVLHHSSTVEIWLKAHCSDGTLFSSTRVNDVIWRDSNFHISISDGHLEFADTFRYIQLQDDAILDVYFWIHVAYTLEWNQTSGLTRVALFSNASIVK